MLDIIIQPACMPTNIKYLVNWNVKNCKTKGIYCKLNDSFFVYDSLINLLLILNNMPFSIFTVIL